MLYKVPYKQDKNVPVTGVVVVVAKTWHIKYLTFVIKKF